MCRFAVCFRLVDGGYSVAYQGTATLSRLSGVLYREHSRPLHTLFGRIHTLSHSYDSDVTIDALNSRISNEEVLFASDFPLFDRSECTKSCGFDG